MTTTGDTTVKTITTTADTTVKTDKITTTADTTLKTRKPTTTTTTPGGTKASPRISIKVSILVFQMLKSMKQQKKRGCGGKAPKSPLRVATINIPRILVSLICLLDLLLKGAHLFLVSPSLSSKADFDLRCFSYHKVREVQSLQDPRGGDAGGVGSSIVSQANDALEKGASASAGAGASMGLSTLTDNAYKQQSMHAMGHGVSVSAPPSPIQQASESG